MTKLTPKQELFVAEWMKDRNGKQAAIRAGYSPRSAETTASTILRYPQVQEEIARRLKRIEERLEITAADISRRAWEIANEDKGDRVGALALLAKRHREFSEKQEHTGSDGGPIQIIRNTPELK